MYSGNKIFKHFFKRNTLWLYFGITFIFSWMSWFGLQFSGESSGFVLDRFWLIAQIGVFSPSITAVFFSYFFGRTILFKKFTSLISIYLFLFIIGFLVSEYKVYDLAQLPLWLKSTILFSAMIVFSFFLFQKRILYTEQSTGLSILQLFEFFISAYFFYPIIFLVVWILFNLLVGDFSIAMFEKSGFAQFPILGITIAFDFLFGGSVGEEIGWRGYALPLLLKRFNPVTASIVLGIIWSLWHIPIDIAVGFGVLGIGGIILRLLTVIPMSVIITWFYLRSRYGIITSLLLHSGINIIPAIGFSNYEIVFGIMIIIQFVIAFSIFKNDKPFREIENLNARK